MKRFMKFALLAGLIVGSTGTVAFCFYPTEIVTVLMTSVGKQMELRDEVPVAVGVKKHDDYYVIERIDDRTTGCLRRPLQLHD